MNCIKCDSNAVWSNWSQKFVCDNPKQQHLFTVDDLLLKKELKNIKNDIRDLQCCQRAINIVRSMD